MGKIVQFLSKALPSYLSRASVSDPATAKHWGIFSGYENFSGVAVSPATAMAQSAVYACVRVISETIGSLPLKIYERQADGGKKEAADHPLYPVLSQAPNAWQTRQEYFETDTGHLCLRGNSYSFKQFSRGGELQALVPLHPDRMTLTVEGTSAAPKFVYEYRASATEPAIKFASSEIWHIKGLSSDGYVGISPLELASNAVGLAISAEKHGSKWFANGARPSIVAKHPGKLREDSSARLKESIQAAISGDNIFKVIVLEEGLDFSTIGLNNVDSQFLETRQFQVEEIARIFRVPCVLIGHPDKTMTYASVEQLMLSFVVHTIRPWVSRIEQSINKNLLLNDPKYFAEFRLEGLLRGDTKSRYEAYASALQNEWMTKNEVRALENMNPVADGDEFKNPAINPVAKQEPQKPNEQKAQDLNITVNTPDIRLETAPITVEAQPISVNVPAPVVNFDVKSGKVTKRVMRDHNGDISGIEEEHAPMPGLKFDVIRGDQKIAKRIIRNAASGEIEAIVDGGADDGAN